MLEHKRKYGYRKNREINIIIYNLYISFAIDRNVDKIIQDRKDSLSIFFSHIYYYKFYYFYFILNIYHPLV